MYYCYSCYYSIYCSIILYNYQYVISAIFSHMNSNLCYMKPAVDHNCRKTGRCREIPQDFLLVDMNLE